jgi:hypothetical protein
MVRLLGVSHAFGALQHWGIGGAGVGVGVGVGYTVARFLSQIGL